MDCRLNQRIALVDWEENGHDAMEGEDLGWVVCVIINVTCKIGHHEGLINTQKVASLHSQTF